MKENNLKKYAMTFTFFALGVNAFKITSISLGIRGIAISANIGVNDPPTGRPGRPGRSSQSRLARSARSRWARSVRLVRWARSVRSVTPHTHTQHTHTHTHSDILDIYGQTLI